MIEEIFQSLDRDKKGFIGYNDFCYLAEEKRRNIDAFVDSGYSKTEKPTDLFTQYL